ncbi:MAG: hypothetical protein J0M17_15845 [Planctomycetes bacterium]|nr:hypothetical protein [Planctomycetota bacterium]
MSITSLAQLQAQVHDAEAGFAGADWGVVSSGHARLDAVLSAGGLRRGRLVEWMATAAGSGPTTLALQAAAEAARGGRPIVVVDRRGEFFPPALPPDFPREQLLLLRCRRDDEAYWACTQALGTSGVAAVVSLLPIADERRLRSWQLAAERGGALGLLVRHLPRQPEVCFSDLRLLVAPSCAAGGRRVSITVLRARQGRPGAMVEVALDDHANPVSDLAPGRHREVARRA